MSVSSIMNSSTEISLQPIFLLSADLNNDELKDVVWGSRDLILAFNGDYPELLWSNTSTIINFEKIIIAESSSEPQNLIIANNASIAYLRLQDGYEWSKISLSPKNISLLAAGFMDSDNIPEIVVFTEDGSLICAESNGSFFWNQTASGTISALVVGDITGNGRDDVVVANETHILALKGSTGETMGNWGISSRITHIRIGSLGNEFPNNGFIALEESGKGTAYFVTNSTPIWSVQLYSGSEWLGISEVFSENANQHYVLANKEGWLFCRDGATGEHIWDRQLSVNITKNLSTADLTDSDALELILATQLNYKDRLVNRIIALSGESGGFLFQVDFPAEVILTTSADWNNDTIVDLGVATSNGWIYALNSISTLPIWASSIPILLNETEEEPPSMTISSNSAETDTERISADGLSLTDALIVPILLIIFVGVGFGVIRYFRKK
jgi:hypothetical protein